MSQIIEYFKQDMRDFAWQLSFILDEFGAALKSALRNLSGVIAEESVQALLCL
jgi:hypothetical protein